MHVTRSESLPELAESLLRREMSQSDSVSRINVLNGRAGTANAQRPERLRLAEAWQLLERAGLICRDPDDHQGDWWFVTGAGRAALSGGDVQGAILLATRGM